VAKLHEGTSLWWYLPSRNKKSARLNLESPDGVDIVKRLAAEANVVIENLRPGGLTDTMHVHFGRVVRITEPVQSVKKLRALVIV